MPLPVGYEYRLPALKNLSGYPFPHTEVRHFILVNLIIGKGRKALGSLNVAVRYTLVKRYFFLEVVEQARIDRIQILMLLQHKGILCNPQQILLSPCCNRGCVQVYLNLGGQTVEHVLVRIGQDLFLRGIRSADKQKGEHVKPVHDRNKIAAVIEGPHDLAYHRVVNLELSEHLVQRNDFRDHRQAADENRIIRE